MYWPRAQDIHSSDPGATEIFPDGHVRHALFEQKKVFSTAGQSADGPLPTARKQQISFNGFVSGTVSQSWQSFGPVEPL